MPHRKIHCENKIEFNVALGSEYVFDYSEAFSIIIN